MSMTVYDSLVRGGVAGCTAAYLSGRVQEEAHKKSTATWSLAALQITHLFLLTAETLTSANVALGAFGLLAQVVYTATPLALLAGLSDRKITRFEQECAKNVDLVYRVGVTVACVATLMLGNPVFAVISLSALAIDTWAKDKSTEAVFAQVKKMAAVFAFMCYGSEVFGAQGIWAGLAKISTVVMGAKFASDIFRSSSTGTTQSVQEEQPKKRSFFQRHKANPVAPRPVFTSSGWFSGRATSLQDGSPYYVGCGSSQPTTVIIDRRDPYDYVRWPWGYYQHPYCGPCQQPVVEHHWWNGSSAPSCAPSSSTSSKREPSRVEDVPDEPSAPRHGGTVATRRTGLYSRPSTRMVSATPSLSYVDNAPVSRSGGIVATGATGLYSNSSTSAVSATPSPSTSSASAPATKVSGSGLWQQ